MHMLLYSTTLIKMSLKYLPETYTGNPLNSEVHYLLQAVKSVSRCCGRTKTNMIPVEINSKHTSQT